MKSRDFARAIVADLRSRRPSPATIAEYARCAVIVHAGDPLDFRRYSIKLLSRHAHKKRRKPGPKPNPERDMRTAVGVHLVRLYRSSLGLDKAIQIVAAEQKLTVNVLRHAYNGKIGKIRALTRRIKLPK